MSLRVVSLLPSATEVLVASSLTVDEDHFLVGRSHECDFPTFVQTRPVLTSAKTKFVSCSQMNGAVCSSLSAGEGLYCVDAAALKALRPDVIITQDLCNVCSVDLKLVQQLCREMKNAPKIISLNPFTLEDVMADILRVGDAVGRMSSAELKVQDLRSRINNASAIGQCAASGRDKPLRVAMLEWIEPIFPGGHWTPQIVKLAGAEHPLNPARENGGAPPSFAMPNEALVDADCDFIILCPCGLDLNTTRREMMAITSQDWWRNLKAVKSARVAIVDGSQHFNRPGPRLVEALEWLTGLLWDRPDIIPAAFPWQWLLDVHSTLDATSSLAVNGLQV